MPRSNPIAHVYLRRSKGDEEHQQFSLDTQRQGALEFIERRLPGKLGCDCVSIREHVDDAKAGDDFSRTGLSGLLSSIREGDAVVCRDQSRLGRNALDVTNIVNEIVATRGARLFFYTSDEEVTFNSAIELAMTFIQGVGHQMELEAIRSRTREALRARVRQGRLAGGACFGYDVERLRDELGRPYSIFVVNEAEAEVVRRIFRDYAGGSGYRAIAIALNREGIPAPKAGRRGSGSWAASCLRAMLLRVRYRGIYEHGVHKRKHLGGKRVKQKAPAAEVLRVDVPEWRIIDEETWLAVQQRFARRARSGELRPRAAKYALTGLGRCAKCGGSIGSGRSRGVGSSRLPSYCCRIHNQRGSSVCDVRVYQPIEEVEGGLIAYLQNTVLSPALVRKTAEKVRLKVAERVERPAVNTDMLRGELRALEGEQTRLASAIAAGGEIPQLVAEMARRTSRIAVLRVELEAAEAPPEDHQKLVGELERKALAPVQVLRRALGNRTDLRRVLEQLFPEGLAFRAHKEKGRRRPVWAISGQVHLADSGANPKAPRPPALGGRSLVDGDPTGT